MVIGEDKTLWENYFLNFRDVASPLRKPALFEWLYNSYKCLYLSCVDPSMISRLADLKTCLCIIDEAVDDSCDYTSFIERNGGNDFTYEMLSMLYNTDKIASGIYTPLNINPGNNTYIKTTLDIFSDLIRTYIMSLPRYCDFRGEFFLAMRNVAESMEFSYLLNKNKTIYPFFHVVHNRAASTMVEVHSILDLMSSENFDASEIGKAIALFKMADTVAMLSNTINTWKREIIERDYSCPVISLALEQKLIKFSDFEKISMEDFEEKLLPVFGMIEDELNETILSMKEFVENYEIKSFDTSKFINNYLNLNWQADIMN
ncbi:MAG: hypothetical protein EHM20_16695 [Alphaproteobacteria bacterium]|nr:MAG: hypothetical protein EHM20_16695 [Alphaproteobacteria bacterium]